MKTFSTRYQKRVGWVKELPPLDSSQTLVLVFGSSSFINFPEPFDDLKQHFSQAIIVGCSTAEESLDDAFFKGSLVVAVMRFDNTKIRFFTTPVDSTQCSFGAGEDIAEHLMADDLSGVLVLSDGVSINNDDLVNGANSKITGKTFIMNGLAGDGSEVIRTWALIEGNSETQSVGGVGFYGGTAQVKHDSSGGLQAFWPERFVTKLLHHMRYELDGKPALALYKKYLGELPASSLHYPLSFASSDSARRLVCTILSVDEGDQSLILTGDVPQGRRVSLMAQKDLQE